MKRTLSLLCLLAMLTQANAAPNLEKALEGTSWRWDTYTLSGVTPVFKIKTPLTLRFNKGIANWWAGCNGMGGLYLLKNDLLSVPEAAGTQMGCSHKKRESDVESAMGRFMQYGVFVKLESKNGAPSKLILNSATTSGVLTLVRARERR